MKRLKSQKITIRIQAVCHIQQSAKKVTSEKNIKWYQWYSVALSTYKSELEFENV
jgi:hypothetical protein